MNIATKIVQACENEDAKSLVETVDQLLIDKYMEHLQEETKNVACNLMVPVEHDWKDRYESYSPDVQESIDAVIEEVENGKDVDKAIDDSVRSKTNHQEIKSKLKEYFDSMVEDSIQVDSSKETGNRSHNHDAMDDEDMNKRVRYESTAHQAFSQMMDNRLVYVKKEDQFLLITEGQAENMKSVFSRLTEDNQVEFVDRLTESKPDFIKVVNFCLRSK